MAVETATYISQLDPTKPGINDPKSEGDDHLRLTKSVLQNQFPSLGAAAVTVTASDLNSVPGKAAKAGDTYSGTHDMTGATVRVATQAATDSSTKAASTEMVQNAILASSGITATLPGQGGNAGKVLKTNGVSPAWGFPDLKLSARTANTQITAADSTAFIDITSGTFTQTFDACASLGNGWWCYLRNSGTGDITLDPNGSETIDGLTSFVMYPGEVRIVICDGSALKSVVLASFYKAFTSSGTFVTPPGYSQFAGLLWGGGGSGGKGNSVINSYSYGGGGGGACVPVGFPASALPASVAVTIAAAATGPSTNSAGSQGNNSTFGALLTAYGGAGGYNNGGAPGGGGGGGAFSAASGGSPGGPGSGASDNAGFGGSGEAGNAVWGGAGGGGSSSAGKRSMYGGAGGGASGGAGGASVYGGAGGAGGVSGTAPGGGGGGINTSGAAAAGDGARGELRIWGVI